MLGNIEVVLAMATYDYDEGNMRRDGDFLEYYRAQNRWEMERPDRGNETISVRKSEHKARSEFAKSTSFLSFTAACAEEH